MGVYSLTRSGITNWVKYSTMSAGNEFVQPDYELISTIILDSSAASVTFTGLATSAAAYKHLQLRMTYTSNAGGNGTYVRGQFNGDSASNYISHYLYGQGSSVISGASTPQPTMLFTAISGTTSSIQADSVIADILDFSSTSKNKTSRVFAGGPGYGSVCLISNAWFSTAPVTSFTLMAFSQGSTSTFGAGARFSLYGLKG